MFLYSRVAMRMNVVAVQKMLQLCYKLPKLEVMFCFRMTRYDILRSSIKSLNSVIMLLHKIKTCRKMHIMASEGFICIYWPARGLYHTKRIEVNADTFRITYILCTTFPAATGSLLVRTNDCAYIAGSGARVDGVRLLRPTLHRRECL